MKKDNAKRTKFISILKYVGIFFLLYLLFFNIIPFIRPKQLSEESLESLKKRKYQATGQDRVVLVEDITDAFNARLALIKESKQSIDIAYHIMQGGQSTDVLFAEIYNAAERGVQVKIILLNCNIKLAT